MKHLKLIGKIIAIVGAVSLWVFFSAKSDYNWADLIIEQETPKGWAVIAKQANFVDITVPWTLIKTPVTGLWFINANNTREVNQGIYLIHELRVSYNYSSTERSESWELVNTRTEESAFIDPEQDPSNININKLKWYKYVTGPGHQIIEFMVSYDKKN